MRGFYDKINCIHTKLHNKLDMHIYKGQKNM